MDECLLLLLNRRFMYALLSRVFCEEPDMVLIDVVESSHVEQELDLIEDEMSDELACVLAQVRERIPDADDTGTRSLTALTEEYTRIFIGPGPLAASPWESMHTTGKRVLFQAEVLDVRESYRKAGFLPARYPVVADDALGLELDFMQQLALRALESWQEGDEEESVARLEQSRDFLQGHLLLWIDKLASSMEDNYGNCFYTGMTRLASAYMKRDSAVTEGLLRAGVDSFRNDRVKSKAESERGKSEYA